MSEPQTNQTPTASELAETPSLVDRCKSYLVDPLGRIKLHELLLDETHKVHQDAFGTSYPANISGIADVEKRLEEYRILIEPLLSCFVLGGRWALEDQYKTWAEALEQMVILPHPSVPANNIGMELRRYPALLLLYAGGISALSCSNWQFLTTLISDPEVINPSGASGLSLLEYLNASTVLDIRYARLLPGMQGHYTPMSETLESTLREPLRYVAWAETRYQRLFDQFEYLLGLLIAERRTKKSKEVWAPLGCFSWRETNGGNDISTQVGELIGTPPPDWPPFQRGLLGGSATGFVDLRAQFDAFVANNARRL